MGQEQGSPEEAAELRARVARLEAQMAELQGVLLRARSVAPPPRPSVAQTMVNPRAAVEAITATVGAQRAKGKDLETELGAKVISKIAVVLLLVGAAFFLKWAVDNHWVGPAERVLIGLAAGAALIVWSERFRRTGTPGFSYALKAVGSGVLYLSLWASFQLYHQVPAGVAFAAMLLVTAWNATMALMQDSRLLAGYALLGAYLTPALISTGGNHQRFLFLYLATIAAAVGVLLRERAWNVLLVAVLPATTAYYCLWYSEWYSVDGDAQTLVLSLILWAVTAAIPLVAKRGEGVLAGVLQPIGAAVFGALTVYSVLVDGGDRAWEPWAAVMFAVVYLALSRVRRGTVLAAIHLSLALSFLTVAIPLKATGHGITVGWLAEALALLWLAKMDGIDARGRVAVQWLCVAAMLLGTGGALMGPWLYPVSAQAFLNREFATAMGAAVMLAAACVMWPRMPETAGSGPSRGRMAGVAFTLLNVVLLVAMRREIGLAISGDDAVAFTFSAWMAVQGAAVLALGFARRSAGVRWAGLVLLGVTLLKTVFYDLRNVGAGLRVLSYLALGALLMGVSYAYQKDLLGLQKVLAEEESGQ